jgi:predicted O-methyltransferase YrrM
MMPLDETAVRALATDAGDRMRLWASFLRQQEVATAAEVGVYRGSFAAHMLSETPSLTRYYMIDPWRHLEDWNKPANRSDNSFEGFFAETMAKTEEFAAKRVVLRGRTSEVVDQIPDGSLDFAYIDGDHTLRGVAIDLARIYPKLREGGYLAGDDFCRNIFQHGREYEPTLVFPYAVYFAEAMGVRIYALPHRQFLMQKLPAEGAALVDIAGGYGDTTLEAQIRRLAAPPKKPRARPNVR